MIERVKSGLLTVLMLTSLLLTALLWYSSPNVEEINRTSYIPQQLIGESRQMDQLVKPRSVIYHRPDHARHYMSFPGDRVYDRAVRALSEWRFIGMKQRERADLTVDSWEQILSEHPGWELRYPTSVPVDLLVDRFLPDSEPMTDLIWVDRIWFYAEGDALYALFISELDRKVYECEVVTQEVTQPLTEPYWINLLPVQPIVSQAASTHPYEPASVNIVYLPTKPLSLYGWEGQSHHIRLSQMRNLLFLDPSLVRTVSNQEEGTIVMQDGSRSVRFMEATHQLYYQHLKINIEAKPVSTDAREAVQFINKHGGWMSDYMLVGADQTYSDIRPNQYAFRLLHNGLPVYDRVADTEQLRFGTMMTVESKGGHVLHYKRSLQYVDNPSRTNVTHLPGGAGMQDALTTWLHDQEHDIHDVRDFFPAYQVKQEKEQLRYTPEWRVQLSDGQVLPFTYTEKDEPPETSDPADQASEPEEEA